MMAPEMEIITAPINLMGPAMTNVVLSMSMPPAGSTAQ